VKIDRLARTGRNGLEHFDSLGDHFFADAVSGNDRYSHAGSRTSTIVRGP
jgi:hypothetical protein